MTENRTDKDLLAESGSGSREAMRVLFVEHQRRVFSVALNFFGGNRQSAEDVTQQVFLKVFHNVENFRGDAEFTTWLYRVTVNTCIDEQRRTRRFTSLTDFFGLRCTKRRTQDEKVHQREICGQVQKAIAELKPTYRLPILLRYVEGLSYEEIAAVLECSRGTVASRLNRGHKLLARKLKHLKNEF